MNANNFMGFYTSKPFWAIKPININESNNFIKQMEEIVVKQDNDLFIIKIARDGKIDLHLKQLENDITLNFTNQKNKLNFELESQYWNKYLNYLNCFSLILDSVTCKIQNIAYFESEELVSSNIFRSKSTGGNTSTMSFPTNKISATYAKARYLQLQGINPSHSLHFSDIFNFRQTITEKTLNETITLFENACKNEKLVKNLAQLNKSLAELKNGNNELSLVLSWFIQEKLLTNLCLQTVNQTKKTQKLTFLKQEKTPIKSKIDFLHFSEILNEQLYNNIEKTRKRRNNIIHQNNLDKEVSIEESINSLISVCQLLSIEYNFQIKINTSLNLASIR